MSKRIAIIGAGTAGLQLGLYLLKHGVTPTLFTDRRPEEYSGMRLFNTVAHHHVTVEREDLLGCNHWPSDEFGYFGHYYYVGTPQPLQFYGDLVQPSRAIDYRIYQPKLLEDYISRGGEVRYKTVAHEDVAAISSEFDTVVVCTGKGPFGEMFKKVPALTPFDRPQRALCVGLFKGVGPTQTRAVSMYFSPGAGELIEIPTWSFNGWTTALVIENHIGGDLEVLANTKYDEDPKAFIKLLLDKLRKHYPTLAERIDEQEFDLANGPLDILQGGVPPSVRESHALLDNGKLAIALGDVQATVDPVLGQGANMASHAALILGEHLVTHDVYDKRFIERVDNARNDRVLGATRWTNYMLNSLGSLDPNLLQFIGAISQNRHLADEFTENFNFPELQWDCFSSPERIQAWIQKRLSGREDAREAAAA
jgi:styrene monooxygenase